MKVKVSIWRRIRCFEERKDFANRLDISSNIEILRDTTRYYEILRDTTRYYEILQDTTRDLNTTTLTIVVYINCRALITNNIDMLGLLQLRRAVMDHVSDSFVETNMPLLVMIEAAKAGNEREMEEYAQVFQEHANKLIEVSTDFVYKSFEYLTENAVSIGLNVSIIMNLNKLEMKFFVHNLEMKYFIHSILIIQLMYTRN